MWIERIGLVCVVVSSAVSCLGGATLAQPGPTQDETCADSDAGNASPEAREAICLRELSARAHRAGNVLSLKLDDGTTKTFRSNPDACRRDDAQRCVNYRLIGFHAGSERYLVYVTGYEGFQCRLVSARTGKATTFLNVPHFAPDHVTFFVTGDDGSYDNWIGIGSVASDPPALVWKERAELYKSWDFVRWIDNDHVALALHEKQTKQGCPRGDCDAVVARTDKSWALERVLPQVK